MVFYSNEWLSFSFKIKDMGEVNSVLIVQIVSDRLNRLLGLSHEAYIKKVILCFKMQNTKPLLLDLDYYYVSKCKILHPYQERKLLDLGSCPKNKKE